MTTMRIIVRQDCHFQHVEIDMLSIYMLLKSVHLFTNYSVQVLTDNYLSI